MPYHFLTPLLTRRALFRLTALLLSAVTIALLCYLLPLLDINADLNPQGENSIAVGLPLAGTVWSILYNGFALLAMAKEWNWHPGVDIAFDCLGWALNWAMGIVLFIWVAMSDDVESICEATSTEDPELCQTAKKVAGIEYTSGALCLVVG